MQGNEDFVDIYLWLLEFGSVGRVLITIIDIIIEEGKGEKIECSLGLIPILHNNLVPTNMLLTVIDKVSAPRVNYTKQKFYFLPSRNYVCNKPK